MIVNSLYSICGQNVRLALHFVRKQNIIEKVENCRQRIHGITEEMHERE